MNRITRKVRAGRPAPTDLPPLRNRHRPVSKSQFTFNWTMIGLAFFFLFLFAVGIAGLVGLIGYNLVIL